MQIHIGICAAGCRSRLEYPQSRWTRCTPSRPPDVWALCFPDHHRPRSLMLLIDAPVCRPQMLLMCDAPGYWVLCFPDHRQTRSPRPRPPSLLLPPPPPRSCATTYAYMLKYVYPINVFMCLCTRICVHAAYIHTYWAGSLCSCSLWFPINTRSLSHPPHHVKKQAKALKTCSKDMLPIRALNACA